MRSIKKALAKDMQKVRNYSYGQRHLAKLFFLLLSVLAVTVEITGQPAVKNIPVIAPSPAAAGIEKYSDYPVSLFTGVPDISIPIFEIKSGDLVLPISISYHAAGIRGDDNSYPVGLGWSLNAAGQISRTLRDKPDETTGSLKTATAYSYNIGNHYAQSSLENLAEVFDKEPDIFSYNLGLKNKPSGKFVFDLQSRPTPVQLNNPMFITQDNVRFESMDIPGGIINLTDGEGVSYKFGGPTNGSRATELATVAPIPNQLNYWTTSWLCSEILPASKHASDKISFSYTAGINTITRNYSGSIDVIDSITLTPSYIFTPGTENHFPPRYYQSSHETNMGTENEWIFTSNMDQLFVEYQENAVSYSTALIQTIIFNGGVAHFAYKPGSNLLSGITILNDRGDTIKDVDFYYSDFPNSGVYPKVRLDSLIFSSGSTAERLAYNFTYNPGPGSGYSGHPVKDYWGFISGFSTYANVVQVPTWENVPAISVTADYEMILNCFLCQKLIYYGSDYLKTFISVGNSSVDVGGSYFTLNQINFPTGGYTQFEYEQNKYKDDQGNLVDVGGLRVKRIKAVAGNGMIQEKLYTYGEDGNGAGIPVNIPTYDDFVRTTLLNYTPPGYNEVNLGDPNGPKYARRRSFFNEPIKDLTFIGGSSVWYTQVEETSVDGLGHDQGKTVYRYELPQLNTTAYFWVTQPGADNIRNSYISGVPGHNFPNLLSKKVFKKDTGGYTPVSANFYQYASRQTAAQTFSPISRYLEYIQWEGSGLPQGPWMSIGDAYISDLTYVLISDSAVTYSQVNGGMLDSGVVATNYIYGLNHKFPISIKSMRSSNDIKISKYRYPLDYTGVLTGSDDFTQGIRNLKQANVLTQPIEEVTELWNGTTLKGVATATISSFLADQPFMNKVYSLENSTLIGGFSQSNVNSGSVILDPRYKLQQIFNYNLSGNITGVQQSGGRKVSYKWDYRDKYPIVKSENATSDEVWFLDADLSGEVIGNKMESPVGYDVAIDPTAPGSAYCLNMGSQIGVLYSGDLTVVPQKIYKLRYWEKNCRLILPVSDGVTLSEKVVATKGGWSLRELRFKSDNVTVSFQFENQGYAKNILISPEDALVSTYTYKPLVGVTSETDPTGRTIYYEYDTFNRLKLQKDEQGNILKKYCYNYAGQPIDCN